MMKQLIKFINITQLMVFSNNMEYDAIGGIVPIQGSFYCTASKKKAFFNCFREDVKENDETTDYIKNYPYKEINKEMERRILTDLIIRLYVIQRNIRVI